MFEQRTKVILGVLLMALAIVVTRLIDMQLVHADVYRGDAENARLLPATTIAPVRGRILDRLGDELATEEPCWEICVAYDVLAIESPSLDAPARRACIAETAAHYAHDLTGESEPDEALLVKRFETEVDRMWDDIAGVTGKEAWRLRATASKICSKVETIHAAVTKRLTYDTPIREERMHHAVTGELDDQQQIVARAKLVRYPWVSVEHSTHRRYHDALAFAHIVGRLGRVSPDDLADDVMADDPFARYLPDDQLGITGVEKAAENLLRGRRGRIQRTRDGSVVDEVKTVDGRDVNLTIRRDLQERLYQLFGEAIAEVPDSPGGAVVVLDTTSRQVLAMVSYPSYDPQTLGTDYESLRDQSVSLPLRFRAVSVMYAPGSIVKPLVCLAGLNDGAITLDTRFDCQGALDPQHPRQFRCWAPAGSSQRMHHGLITAEEAIKYSCNIFMYHTGQNLGVAAITDYFRMAGFGQPAGTGLIEESRGINPTPSYLVEEKGRAITPSTAWLFAIGQAEVSVTPLQAANLMAVYATGKSQPVTLVEQLPPSPLWQLPGDSKNWNMIRRGMYEVVNAPDGTAHAGVAIAPETGYALCGKTGSAQSGRSAVAYKIRYVDEHEQPGVTVVHAETRDLAIERFTVDHPNWAFAFRDVEPCQWWPNHDPPPGRSFSHAWFGGFLQPLDSTGQPDWSQTSKIALAVLVEYGGSGGHVAAPIGKKVAEAVIDVLGPQLDVDRIATGATTS